MQSQEFQQRLKRLLYSQQRLEVEEANIFQKIMIWFANLFSFFSTNDVKAAKIYPLNQG
jgi:D-alanyl-D-alanine carboxypeptidase (penicillin-binding protein 5/6)